MAMHKIHIEVEFEIDDEVGLTAESDLLEAGLHAPEYGGFQSALEHKAIMVAKNAWDAEGLQTKNVKVFK